jgi:two-component system OmpR family response regulator
VRVLVAEDDPGLRSVLERGLREGGYVVDAVADGEAAVDFLRAYEYEVVVLDWRMPGMTGLEVVQSMRRGGSLVPVLMLTARDTPADRVSGLDGGADDYLVKPFDFDELLARLRALQRRAPTQQGGVLKVGDLIVDPATRQVDIGGDAVVLTSTEFAILELLARRSPTVVERRSIAVQVWDHEADALGSNTIDVHMARLRAKIQASSAKLETMRGVGYRLSE